MVFLGTELYGIHHKKAISSPATAGRVAGEPKDSICISLQIGGYADHRFIAVTMMRQFGHPVWGC